MLISLPARRGSVQLRWHLRSSVYRAAGCSLPRRGIHWIYTDEDSNMAATTDSMLLKFRDKDSRFGVTRDTVRALASALDISETLVVHMALSRFAEDLLPAYEPDDGALNARQLAALRKAAAKVLPTGKLTNRSSLF